MTGVPEALNKATESLSSACPCLFLGSACELSCPGRAGVEPSLLRTKRPPPAPVASISALSFLPAGPMPSLPSHCSSLGKSHPQAGACAWPVGQWHHPPLGLQFLVLSVGGLVRRDPGESLLAESPAALEKGLLVAEEKG